MNIDLPNITEAFLNITWCLGKKFQTLHLFNDLFCSEVIIIGQQGF